MCCGDVLCCLCDVLCGDVLCGDVLCGDVLCGDVMCCTLIKFDKSIPIRDKYVLDKPVLVTHALVEQN